MSFMQALRTRWELANSLVCVGLDPEPAKFPAQFAQRPGRGIQLLPRDRRCHRRLRLQLQAADRPLRRPGRGGRAGAPGRAHPCRPPRRPGHPRQQARRHRQHGAALRRRGVRPLRRRCGDCQPLPRPRFAAAVPRPRRSRRGDPVPHLQPGSRRSAGPRVHAIDGRPLYQHVAEKVARDWNGNGNCALVVGATWPEQLREVRAIVGDVPFLVPGVGAQGGDVEAVVTNARTADGTGLIVSSSRAILYASNGDAFADAAATAAKTLRDEINRYR